MADLHQVCERRDFSSKVWHKILLERDEALRQLKFNLQRAQDRLMRITFFMERDLSIFEVAAS